MLFYFFNAVQIGVWNVKRCKTDLQHPSIVLLSGLHVGSASEGGFLKVSIDSYAVVGYYIRLPSYDTTKYYYDQVNKKFFNFFNKT